MPNKRKLLLALLCLPLASVHAEITRLSITTLAGGKEVSSLVLPIGQRYKLEFSANKLEYPNDDLVHAQGNVRLAVRSGRQASTMVGDDILVRREILGAAEAAAIRALVEMGRSDQQYRRRPGFADDPHLQRLQSRIDRRNQEKLRTISAAYGWPGARLAGADGAQAAFLVLQHSPPGQLQAFLPQLREAHARNDLPGTELALAEDRVLVANGLPQKYGTQLDLGRPAKPFPIEDEVNVDMRRAQMGLIPLREYLQLLGVPE